LGWAKDRELAPPGFVAGRRRRATTVRKREGMKTVTKKDFWCAPPRTEAQKKEARMAMLTGSSAFQNLSVDEQAKLMAKLIDQMEREES
jgi:hypothetical protein